MFCGYQFEVDSENYGWSLCISHIRDSTLSGNSDKDTLDEWKVELEENLQAKYSSL